MNEALLSRFGEVSSNFSSLKSRRDTLTTSLSNAQNRMKTILAEQDLNTRTQFALKQVKPLLSQSSIIDCQNLANSALRSVFESNCTVEWSYEDSQFMLVHPADQDNATEFRTPLTAEGGGILQVLSFVFQTYLILKVGCRRFMCLDEAFGAISDVYLDNFKVFTRQLCKDLKMDVMLVSHDSRIEADDTDRMYVISDGISKRVK